MITTAIRLICIASLSWTTVLAGALLRISLSGAGLILGDKPRPHLSEVLLPMAWPLALIPGIWLILLVASARYTKIKEIVEHHLFISSLIAVSLTIAFTLSVGAALPYIPVITRIGGQ